MAASGRTYEVFISHAGPQKANFACWLQFELQRHGVSAFLDETSLQLGDAADKEMEQALRTCSIVIVVFTADFVRSRYCMQELHWALHPQQPHPPLLEKHAEDAAEPPNEGSVAQSHKRQRTTAVERSRQPPVLMPVFYHTADVGALPRQLQQEQTAEAQVSSGDAWRQQCLDDLKAACRVTGDRLDSYGKLDIDHVNAIVAAVLRRLGRPRFQPPTYSVDLKERTQALLPLLQPDEPIGVCVLSLCGMGGIGKTTLAQELFNRLSSSSSRRFSRQVFLEVGPDTQTEAKQEQLSRLLAGGGAHAHLLEAGSAAERRARLTRQLQTGGALLLGLDSLWSAEQLEALLPLDALPAGSRVLLTGRDPHNLLAEGAGPQGIVCLLRQVGLLPLEAAKRLLCLHGFGADTAPDEFGDVVQQALDVCRGLPLALQAVGSGLRCKMPAETLRDLRKLFNRVNRNSKHNEAAADDHAVMTVLRWSYDQLPIDHRQMFLDAALLLKGRPVNHLLEVWVALLLQREPDGYAPPPSLRELQREVQGMWDTCKSASLVNESGSTLRTVSR